MNRLIKKLTQGLKVFSGHIVTSALDTDVEEQKCFFTFYLSLKVCQVKISVKFGSSSFDLTSVSI